MTARPPRLLTLVMLTALTVLSLNMFLPALPAMRAEFGVSEAVMGRAISLYMGVAAVLQLVIGRLSDRIGRRPVMLGMLAIYVLASVTCLLSRDVGVFLAARTVQAVAVAGGVLSSAMVRDMFDGREAAAKLSLIASAMAVAPMLAPMLGGLVESLAGWRGIFGLYTAFGAGLLAWCWWALGETRDPGRGTPARMAELLRERLFWAYAMIQALGVGVFFVFLTGAPFVAADVFGLGPVQIGVMLGAPTLGFMTGAGIGARFMLRIGPMPLILTGRCLPLLGIGAALIYYTAGGAAVWPMFPAAFLFGLGNGLSIPASNAGAISVRPDLAGSAAGLAGALALAFGAVLTTAATWLLSRSVTAEALLGLLLAVSAGALLAALAARAWAGVSKA